MLGSQLLHKILRKALPFVHAKRLATLIDAVEALLIGKKLSLTLLGRNLLSKSKERHCIRRIDRLLGNSHLQSEVPHFYRALNELLIPFKRPIICVDWSCINKRKDWHLLRATLAIKGRGMVVYQEVHPKGCQNSPRVQKKFLQCLKAILPKDCQPIIVSDAGFLGPWFKAVEMLGFDWVGRLRTKTNYQFSGQREWKNCLDLYDQATTKVKYIGRVMLAKRQKQACSMILVKQEKRFRKHYNRSGKPTNNTESNRCLRRANDPWLLVTSLRIDNSEAKKISDIYAKRMQIEEDFRDTKSHQYGFGLRYSRTNGKQRIGILLLIAALASFICWLIALTAKRQGLDKDFQANSVRNKPILSVIYLGCQVVRRKIQFKMQDLWHSLKEFRQLIWDLSLC